ncbi:MAG: hypothetical protein P8X63_01180 [Desulfuromonadaceae bacterium]
MDLPFQSQQETTPGFRPGCKISSAGGAGAGGGLLDMAANLLGAPQDDPWADHLRSIELELAPAPFISTARLQLVRSSEAPQVALGDELRVELGYDDSLQGVFTGKVLMLEDSDSRVREILLGCGGHGLAQLRQYVSFENQGLSDVLGQWAGEAGLGTGNMESGPRYPFLAIDDSRSLWEWSALLAAHAGAWVWTDADNNLNCKPPGDPGNRSYSYGSDLLGLRFCERTSLFGEIRVSGEGCAGSQGAQAWSWLAKNADGISASTGQGDPQRLYQSGSLRNQEAAQSFGRGLESGAGRMRQAALATVPGSPELGLGQTFALSGCPDGRGDGSFIITRVLHRYDKGGFITRLSGVTA